MTDANAVHEEVRSRYAEAARSVIDPTAPPAEALASNRRLPLVTTSCCDSPASCAAGADEEVFGSILYDVLERACPTRRWPAWAAATQRPWPS